MRIAIEKRFREALDASKLSQSAAARACGLAPSRINDFYNGNRVPSPTELFMLAKGLKISADFLLGVPGAPMHVAQAFTDGLEDAVARHIVTQAINEQTVPELWVREILTDLVKGGQVLDMIARLAREDVEAAAAYLRTMAAGSLEIQRAYPAGNAPEIVYNMMGKPPTDGTVVRITNATYRRLAAHIIAEAEREGLRRGTKPRK